MRISKMHITKAYYYLIYVCSIIFAGFVIYVTFVAIYPLDILQVKKDPLPVLNENKQVKRGEHLYLELEYCKNLPFSATYETHLEDGVKWDLPGGDSNYETGCFTRTIDTIIPKEIPLNEPVRFQRVLIYQTSPFTTKQEVLFSEFFTVIE